MDLDYKTAYCIKKTYCIKKNIHKKVVNILK